MWQTEDTHVINKNYVIFASNFYRTLNKFIKDSNIRKKNGRLVIRDCIETPSDEPAHVFETIDHPATSHYPVAARNILPRNQRHRASC